MGYAIIELGGKQYRVEKGDSLVVDRLAEQEGARVTPKAILYASQDKTLVEGSDLEKVKVEAVVAEHLKGEKVRVFKYRPKKRYRRRAGHRSLLTRLEIKDIKLAQRKPAAARAASRAKPAAAKVGTGAKAAKKEGAAKSGTQEDHGRSLTGKNEKES